MKCLRLLDTEPDSAGQQTPLTSMEFCPLMPRLSLADNLQDVSEDADLF